MKIGIVSRDRVEIEILRQILRTDPDLKVIWIARYAEEATANCAERPVDIVLLGMGLPATGGVESVKQIMRESPCPILLLANSIADNSGPIFEAIGAGALDVIASPSELDLASPAQASLLAKLGMLRKLDLGRVPHVPAQPATRASRPQQLVLLGASAGGPAALATVLASLPRDFAAPVIIVQHIDAQFVTQMAEWLGQHGQLPVRVAGNGEALRTGFVYMAGGSDHLVLLDRYTLGYRVEPKDHPYRPSIDELFSSVARFWKGDVVAALLTGMGRDGAAGLRLLRVAGALTITQDRESSVVYGIPKAAAQLNAAVEVLPLERIGPRIHDAVRTLNRRGDD